MKRELGEIPPRQQIVNTLISHFETILGPLQKAKLHSSTLKLMAQLETAFSSPDYIFRRTPKMPSSVKIKSGLEIFHGMYKAPGGLIRSSHTIENTIISQADFTGDFQLFPKSSSELLGASLKNTEKNQDLIVEKLADTYKKSGIQSPGVTPEDLFKSLAQPGQ